MIRTFTVRLRFLMTYVLPCVITAGVILCGLWIVPDTMYGMYGNVDGKWMSWSTRGILTWSSFLDFGPYSPLTGTGSPFLPDLPWLNPGAMALSLPLSLEYRHLLSYVIYVIEFTFSLYFVFTELGLRRDYAYTAVLSYVAFFFPPFNSISSVPPWYSLGPFVFHETAGMNLATIALLRGGWSSIRQTVVWSVVFVAALFSVFASAPMHALIYVPVYGTLWTLVSVATREERRALSYRISLLLFTGVVFAGIGIPAYLLASAAVSARDSAYQAFLHPGMALLTVDYWSALAARFSPCSSAEYLICPSGSPTGWVQLMALAGGSAVLIVERGRLRMLAATVVSMILALHFYYLISLDNVLGRFQIVGYRYLYWTLFPLLFGVAIAGVVTLCRLGSRRNDGLLVRWMPAVANTAIAIALLMIFANVIWVRQPPMDGPRLLGMPPIARIPANRGPMVRYLEEHTALTPNTEFRGYASLFLGAGDDPPTHAKYVAARTALSDQFGNMFQLSDLWNSNIPTLEDYGQWLTKQMFIFNLDVFTKPEHADPHGVATHVYAFLPEPLAILGVRYVVSDEALESPSITEVLRETSTRGATLYLYELQHANVGNLSPTTVVTADSYEAALSYFTRPHAEAILIKPTTVASGLVKAEGVRLTAVKGGYHISARSPGASLLVLPVQYTHCWRLIEPTPSGAVVLRVNVVQTGIYFQRGLDAELKFAFGLWNSSCRQQDGSDMDEYFAGRRATSFGLDGSALR